MQIGHSSWTSFGDPKKIERAREVSLTKQNYVTSRWNQVCEEGEEGKEGEEGQKGEEAAQEGEEEA